jgi:hypothetical protein
MKNFTTLHGITKNKMGTLSIDLQISGMRKPQDFIFYPITKESKNLTIQSNTRIGTINLDGCGKMTKSHSNGAYFVHLSIDELTPFEFNKSDWQQIVEYLGLTEGDNVGDSGVSTDNSGAKSIFNL